MGVCLLLLQGMEEQVGRRKIVAKVCQSGLPARLVYGCIRIKLPRWLSGHGPLETRQINFLGLFYMADH